MTATIFLQLAAQSVLMKEDWSIATQSPQTADANLLVPVKSLHSMCLVYKVKIVFVIVVVSN